MIQSFIISTMYKEILTWITNKQLKWQYKMIMGEVSTKELLNDSVKVSINIAQ